MRLTNAIRNKILDDVINKIIQPKIDTVKKKLDYIIQYSANRKYSDKITKWVRQSPQGGLTSYGKIMLNVGGGHFHCALIHNCSHRPYFSLNVSMKVLAEDQHNAEVCLHDDMIDNFNTVRNNLNNIENEKDNIHSVISSALWACNTIKQLENNYPDLMQYIPKFEKVAKSLTVTNDKVSAILKGGAS